MTVESVRAGRRRVVIPAFAGAGIAVSAIPLTWWAIGDLGDEGPDHMLGPIRVSTVLLYFVGWAAIATAAASVGAIAVASLGARTSRLGLSYATTCLTVVAGALVAVGGRIVTAGGDGANIGGGAILLTGPVLLAVLLLWAAVAQYEYRRASLRLGQRNR